VREESVAIEHADAPPIELQRGLALGFLAMTPLLAAYEIARAASGGTWRNAAEVVLSLPLAPLGSRADLVRMLLLGVAAAFALKACFHSQLGLVARTGRIVAEGALGALVIGPVLIAMQRVLSLPQPATLSARGGVPDLAQGVLISAGAAWEEILFRIVLQSALFVLLVQIVQFFTASKVVARTLAGAGSIVIASLLFAAAHLSTVTYLLGPGGERFDPAVFSWRFLAGVALGLLYRWRGPGVAAWTHALFDLALFIGAGPDVFL
jgi:membrane protease YdiL (CAAX protease family)